MIVMLAKSIQLTMVGLLLVVLGCCLFFSWRGSKSLQTVTAGLDTLAQGGTVSLPAAGFAGELAQKLNETSEQLRRRNEIIARRDTARTEWIAGVSHDIRTPLALILAGRNSCSGMPPCPQQPDRKRAASAPSAKKSAA